ncbi:MAG: ATP-binding protein [Planctomycetota bacterium]
MIAAQKPANEVERLAALRRTGLLDTPSEHRFDEIVRLASEIAETPMALVSLVDEDRQWFKARFGLAAAETPREFAFCAHAILEPEQVFRVPDTLQDVRFADNPLVTGAPHLRSYYGVPLRAPSGHPIGTLCVLDDRPHELSEQRVRALETLSRQVERIVALEDARDNALAANREKARFLAIASHEIRSPLHSVVGTLQLALEDAQSSNVGSPLVDDLHTALDASRGLADLVQALLGASRSEAQECVRETVEWAPFLEQTLVEWTRAAERKGIKLRTEVTAAPFGEIDRTRLSQILHNLVGNGVRFTDEGAVVVRVEPSGEGRVRVSVADSGPGIPEDDHARIFEPFERSGTRGGTGLGLHVTRGLVAQLEGRIELESAPGHGSEFSFAIPCPTSAIEADAPRTPRADELPSARILVVDDEPGSRRVTERLLLSLGLEAHGASNGAEAFELLARGGFDLVLMDYSMPVASGADVCRDLRARFGDAIPVIGFTASAHPDVVEECLGAGMQDVLPKPIRIDVLAGAVARTLQA